MARISKIYGAGDYPILYNRDDGGISVTKLKLGATAGGVEGTAITASAANINAVANAAIVSVTSAGALSAASHGGRVTVINSAAGIALTLPAATGSGTVLNLYIGTTITSLTTTITAAGSDKLAGIATQCKTDNTTKTYVATAASTTAMTMDGTTKGGIKGDRIKLVDIASGLWAIEVVQTASGVVASPFN